MKEFCTILLISGAFEHSMLRVLEIYALENVVFHIVLSLYEPHKPYHILFSVHATQNVQMHKKSCQLGP